MEVYTHSILHPAYVAGLFDGEGCISISTRRSSRSTQQSFGIELSISMVEREALDAIASAFGSNVRADKARTERHSPTFRWSLVSHKMRPFIAAIRPYSVTKAAQLDIGILFLDTFTRRTSIGRPVTPEVMATRLAMKEEMHALKGNASRMNWRRR